MIKHTDVILPEFAKTANDTSHQENLTLAQRIANLPKSPGSTAAWPAIEAIIEEIAAIAPRDRDDIDTVLVRKLIENVEHCMIAKLVEQTRGYLSHNAQIEMNSSEQLGNKRTGSSWGRDTLNHVHKAEKETLANQASQNKTMDAALATQREALALDNAEGPASVITL